jgi:hypothetical protein
MSIKRTKGVIDSTLRTMIDPGETISARLLAQVGPSPFLLLWIPPLLIGLPVVATGLLLIIDHAGLDATSVFATVCSIAGVLGVGTGVALPLITEKQVWLAVTDTQLICYKVSWFGRRPIWLLFSATLSDVQLTDYQQGWALDSVKYRGPSGTAKPLRINLAQKWRPELSQMLAIISPQGHDTKSPAS